MRKKRDKFKFSVALTTEILELITLTLTLLLFLCSTGELEHSVLYFIFD